MPPAAPEQKEQEIKQQTLDEEQLTNEVTKQAFKRNKTPHTLKLFLIMRQSKY